MLEVAQRAGRISSSIASVILGKEEVIRACVVSLLAGGHVIVEDFPGVGKTLLAKSLARSIDCRFSRVQFTPDLLPSDVTGVSVFNQKSGEFEFRPGPIFANVVLGRRDQQVVAQDPVEPAGMHGGTAGDRRQLHALLHPRSWSSPRRTPSNTRGPIRCPRRSWIVS